MVQSRPQKEGYETHHERLVVEKPTHILTSIRPLTESDARKWVGACNRHDAAKKVTEHFANEVRRLA